VVALGMGCGEAAPQDLTLAINLGGESDALRTAPVPTRLRLTVENPDGTERRSLQANLDGGALALGEDPRGTLVRFIGVAENTDGRVLLRGRTLLHTLGDQARIELFLSRTDTFARLPAQPPTPPDVVCDLALSRYLVWPRSSGTGAVMAAYDLLNYVYLPTVFEAPFVADTFFAQGARLYYVGKAGDPRAYAELDVQSGETISNTPSAAITDIAGSAVSRTRSGMVVILAATRPNDLPSAAVWTVGPGEQPVARQLSVARARAVTAPLGADALWITSEGAAPETLTATAGASGNAGTYVTTLMPQPPPPARPLAAASSGERYVLVWLRDGRVVRYDRACSASCDAPTVATLPASEEGAAWSLGDAVLFVGPTGGYVVRPEGGVQITPPRAPRVRNRLLGLPTWGVGLVGAGVPIEVFAPP
jgi:hypothetical protein